MPTPATIHAAFAATAAAHPDAPFLIVPRREDREWRPEGGTWTYLQVHAEVEAIKSVYAAAHYGLGHRVALLLENRPEFFFQSLALNALGVSIVPVNPEYRLEELRYQMDHSGAEMVVGLTAYLPRLTMVAAACGRPLAVVDATAFPKALPPPTSPSRRSMPPGRAGEGA